MYYIRAPSYVVVVLQTAVDYVCEHMASHVQFWVERGEQNLGEILKMAFNDVHEAFIRHLLQHHAGTSNAPG